MNGRPWTREDLDWLRRFRRDRVSAEDVADAMGRTLESVKAAYWRYRIHHPDGRRFWTPAEDAIVRREYKRVPTVELAARLGRSRRAVHMHARLLGLTDVVPRLGPEFAAMLRQRNAEGATDTQIAVETGKCRSEISRFRRRIKVPVSAAGLRAAQRRGIDNQRKTLGIRTSGQLRSLSFRRFAERRGWPADLRPREVQILEALAAGPLTRRQIAERLGMSALGRNALKSNGSPKGDDGGAYKTTYLSELMSRGLVVYQHRAESSGRQGIGRIQGLYWLTAAALDVIINRSHANPKEDCNVENKSEHPRRRSVHAAAR